MARLLESIESVCFIDSKCVAVTRLGPDAPISMMLTYIYIYTYVYIYIYIYVYIYYSESLTVSTTRRTQSRETCKAFTEFWPGQFWISQHRTGCNLTHDEGVLLGFLFSGWEIDYCIYNAPRLLTNFDIRIMVDPLAQWVQPMAFSPLHFPLSGGGHDPPLAYFYIRYTQFYCLLGPCRITDQSVACFLLACLRREAVVITVFSANKLKMYPQ